MSFFSLAARKLIAKSESHLQAFSWSLCSAFSLSTFSSVFSLILFFISTAHSFIECVFTITHHE